MVVEWCTGPRSLDSKYKMETHRFVGILPLSAFYARSYTALERSPYRGVEDDVSEE